MIGSVAREMMLEDASLLNKNQGVRLLLQPQMYVWANQWNHGHVIAMYRGVDRQTHVLNASGAPQGGGVTVLLLQCFVFAVFVT